MPCISGQGPSSILLDTVTDPLGGLTDYGYDRYGHLMPGHEGEAAQMLTEYLDRHVGSLSPEGN